MPLNLQMQRVSNSAPKWSAPVLAAGLSFLTLLAAGPSHAEEAASNSKTLRICAAANEAPYSVKDETGFENKIAKLLAGAMGKTVEFVWSPKPAIYAVRDQLDKKLCDVVMGVDTGDKRVLTSEPYYKAPYVFVIRKDSPLKVESWESPDLLKAKKIGFVPGSPADVMMNKLDLYNNSINYVKSLTNFKDRRNSYTRIPPQRMVGEVADKTADLAVAFAPEVARYVKANDALKMVVIPDNNVRSDGEKVPHHFDQSIAVRQGDKDLLAEINQALPKVQDKIESVLDDEGVPFVPPPPRT